MNRSTLRIIILITALITAFVHLVVLNIPSLRSGEGLDLLFTLNGLGYLGLIGAFILNLPFLRGREAWVVYALMAFTVVTIIAWIAVGARSTLGYLTKLDEAILLAASALYLRQGPSE